jgi:hypothetical protein
MFRVAKGRCCQFGQGIALRGFGPVDDIGDGTVTLIEK